MVICPDCGKDVPESKFCKNCGAYIKDVKSPAEPSDKFGFCSNCGHELDGEYSFCPECGADISSKDEVNATDVTETEESPMKSLQLRKRLMKKRRKLKSLQLRM